MQAHKKEGIMERDLRPGDIVRNFKRETVHPDSDLYLYQIIAFATHSETNEKLVIYQALYSPCGVWARPYDMFMGEVDREKYPEISQRYRFEKIEN